MTALPEENAKQPVSREPLPDEIESKDEANHPLKKYADIAQRLRYTIDSIHFSQFANYQRLRSRKKSTHKPQHRTSYTTQ